VIRRRGGHGRTDLLACAAERVVADAVQLSEPLVLVPAPEDRCRGSDQR
jgi:hypothetical protein